MSRWRPQNYSQYRYPRQSRGQWLREMQKLWIGVANRRPHVHGMWWKHEAASEVFLLKFDPKLELSLDVSVMVVLFDERGHRTNEHKYIMMSMIKSGPSPTQPATVKIWSGVDSISVRRPRC